MVVLKVLQVWTFARVYFLVSRKPVALFIMAASFIITATWLVPFVVSVLTTQPTAPSTHPTTTQPTLPTSHPSRAPTTVRYDAYVTSNGTNNSLCSQSAPCGLFHFVIRNVENGYIPDDDLYIHINGSDLSVTDDSYCEVTLTGNITFIFDSDTIQSASDWFGSGILSLCTWGCVSGPMCTRNILTVDEGTNVAFYDLIWDHWMQFLRSSERSTFYCERCRIQNTLDKAPWMFLLSNEATFKESIFYNISSGSLIGLYPMTILENDPNFDSPQTDSVLILSGCLFWDVSSTPFIDISASTGIC